MSMLPGVDMASLQNEASRLSSEGGSSDFLDKFVKMPDGNGSVSVRILPPAPAGAFGNESNPFYQATRIIRLNDKTLHSPNELVGKRWVGDCPVTKYYQWLWRESERKDPTTALELQAKARSIKPIERYYYNVIVRQETNSNNVMETNVGPKILSVGKTLHKMIIRAMIGDESLGEKPLGDVTHPTTGRDFRIVKEMKKSGNESYPNYAASRFEDVSVLGEPEEVAKWSESMNDLTALRTLKPVEEMVHEMKVHLGIIQDTDGSFDPSEFESPAASTSTTVSVEADVPTTANTVDSVVTESEDGSDDDMADDDFMNKLKSFNAA